MSSSTGVPSTSAGTRTTLQENVTPRDLTRELEDGIKPWIGPSIFSTSPSLPFSTPPRKLLPPRRNEGTSSSPITISSAESSPVILDTTTACSRTSRPRGVAQYNSALPRTAFTPPKPHSTSNNQVHPFFNRTKSLPPPASQRPRLIAHYSSTESSSQRSESTVTDSQSTFGDTVSPAVPERTSTTGRKEMKASVKGKGKEIDGGPGHGFSDDTIDAMADEFARVEIRRKPLGSGSTARAISKNTTSGPSKISRPPIAKASSSTDPTSSSKARLRSTVDPSANYFSYHRLPRPPAVAYITTPDEANDLVSCLKGDVFGFDLEWPPTEKHWDGNLKKYYFGQGRTALVQICDRDTILLIHMTNMTQLPEKVKEFIEDSTKFKLGVQISGDGHKLIRDFQPGLNSATSLLELSKLARRVDGQSLGPGNTLISLAKLTERYLGYPLRKEKDVRSGNWASILDQDQKDYAANDVYASLMIYDHLVKLGKDRSIEIDRRSMCSDHGNYQAVNGSGGIPNFAKRDNSSLYPTPAQARTLSMFIEGESTEEIASTMGIKRATVQTYLAAGIGRIDSDCLGEGDKRRFLIDVEDSYWVKKSHGGVLAQIMAELGQLEAEVDDTKAEENGKEDEVFEIVEK